MVYMLCITHLNSGLTLAAGPIRSLRPIQALTNDKAGLYPLDCSPLPHLFPVSYLRLCIHRSGLLLLLQS